MRDPGVLVVTFAVIQFARDLLALLREKAARVQTRVVIIRREAP
jgi:hypothetical protein